MEGEKLEKLIASKRKWAEHIARVCTAESNQFRAGDIIAFCDELAQLLSELDAPAAASAAPVESVPQIQVSGPQCKQCGAFTTYVRVESHGMCMKCEYKTLAPAKLEPKI